MEDFVNCGPGEKMLLMETVCIEATPSVWSYRMYVNLRTVKFICWTGALIGLLPRVMGHGFEVQGTIHYEGYLGGTTNKVTTKLFKVEVNGCAWRIRTTVPGDCAYKEKAFRQGDLFNLYLYCASPTGPSTNSYVTSMETDELPDDDGSQINYLWLAYASNCYFDHEDGVFLRPICCLDDRELRTEKFKVQSYLARSEVAPRLPIWIAYMNDGFYRTTGSQGRIVFRAPPPFDAGYTNAVYSVLSLTNYESLQIPLAFEFTRFAVPRNPSMQSTLVVRTRILGTVTHLAPNTTSNLLPQFSGETYALDNRYRSVDARIGQLRYRIRDGVWANETNAAVAKNVALKERALQDRADGAQRRLQPSNRSGWFKAFWAGFCLFSLGALFMLSRRSKNCTK